ncbi:MAG: hypothetical protein M3Z66_05480 [Chloroflexota bacterium]|nr:hypothetical protein [Chloroflexota bacterium]
MRVFRVLLPVALFGAALIGGSIPAAHAQGPSPDGNGGSPTTSTPSHVANHGLPLATGSHFIYVEDGGCPDTIEVYAVSLSATTLIQTYTASGACQSNTYYGANELGYAAATSSHGICLIQASSGAGTLSYTIDPSTHMITAQVSLIPDPLAGQPGDVRLTPNNNLAVVTSTNGVESYSIGAGCALTEVSAVAAGDGSISSSALFGSKGVVSTDIDNNTLYTFGLAANGTLTLAKAVASQISSPDSAATDGPLAFTGQATISPPQAQEGKVDTTGNITYSAGSPQSDPAGTDGAAAWFEKVHGNFVQGEQFSGSLGFYHASPFAFSQHVALPSPSSYPTEFFQLGPYLLVLERVTNEVDYCTTSSAGASSCTTLTSLSRPVTPEGITGV